MFTLVEMGLSLLAACFPNLMPLFRKIKIQRRFPRLYDTLTSN